MYSFPNLEPVYCSMSGSNCCFLTHIQISQEPSKKVWYSPLSQDFPQFVVIYTVKGFGIINKTEVDVFLEFSCLLMIQQMLATWFLVPLPFLNPTWTYGSSQFTYCWSLTWRIISITLLVCEMSTIVQQFQHSLHGLSLRLQWKLTFSSPVATAEFPNLLACWVQHFHSLIH